MLSRWKGRFTSFISALVIPYLLTPLLLSGKFLLLLLTEPSICTYYHPSLGFIVTPSSTVDVQAPRSFGNRLDLHLRSCSRSSTIRYPFCLETPYRRPPLISQRPTALLRTALLDR
ncbi:hypothetical protein EDB83DRAFT_2364296 [Lactarius deliciosus]|nr:hypothetical protein EDB83DRAFT_2364296 [Lactarius deliciosus]